MQLFRAVHRPDVSFATEPQRTLVELMLTPTGSITFILTMSFQSMQRSGMINIDTYTSHQLLKSQSTEHVLRRLIL